MRIIARSIIIAAVLGVLVYLVPISYGTFVGTTSNSGNSFTASNDFTPNPAIRVTTYEIKTAAGFTGTTYTLTLNQNLKTDYFVMLRGAAGNNDSGTNRNPAQDYARIDRDPHGNFGTNSSANQLRLIRGAGSSTWTGQVTVFECLGDCGDAGFVLKKVNEISMNSGATSARSTAGGNWSGQLGQIGLYGGSMGGGMSTTSTVRADHKTGWARIWPSGANRINLSRTTSGNGSLSGTTTFTVYAVQWGSGWTIQRANVTGNAGAGGMNTTSSYNTASISAVTRADTFVVAYGHIADNKLSSGWEGNVYTLGNGVATNATENTVAVGSENGQTRDVEVYVHTHADLSTQYKFGTDNGTPGILKTSLSGTHTISSPIGSETYNTSNTVGYRFALFSNSSNGNGTAFPRPIIWGQLDSNTSARWQRSRQGQQGAYWLQVPDFRNVTY